MSAIHSETAKIIECPKEAPQAGKANPNFWHDLGADAFARDAQEAITLAGKAFA